METRDYQINRKLIRRLHLRVYPNGQVVVSAPWFMPEKQVRDFVDSQWNWVMKTKERYEQYPPKPLPKISKEQAHELQWFLEKRVEYWRQIMNEEPVTWKLRNMKTQWGNCRAKTRQLTFNLQLALVANELRDYIIVHELSHLKVQNHGPLFKERLTLFMPDWKMRKQQLKEYLSQLNNNNE